MYRGCTRRGRQPLVSYVPQTVALCGTCCTAFTPVPQFAAAGSQRARVSAVFVCSRKVLSTHHHSARVVPRNNKRNAWLLLNHTRLTHNLHTHHKTKQKHKKGMKLMKKDMGGGALVLALAHLVMSAALPVRLRVLVPAVENAISGNAYRPLDVLATRAGITVEVEGVVWLCAVVCVVMTPAAGVSLRCVRRAAHKPKHRPKKTNTKTKNKRTATPTPRVASSSATRSPLRPRRRPTSSSTPRR